MLCQQQNPQSADSDTERERLLGADLLATELRPLRHRDEVEPARCLLFVLRHPLDVKLLWMACSPRSGDEGSLKISGTKQKRVGRSKPPADPSTKDTLVGELKVDFKPDCGYSACFKDFCLYNTCAGNKFVISVDGREIEA